MTNSLFDSNKIYQDIKDKKARYMQDKGAGNSDILLSMGLSLVMDNLSPPVIKEIYSEIQATIDTFKEIPAGYQRAFVMHYYYENIQSAMSEQIDKSRVKCHKGCCGCCYLPIVATEDEAELLVKTVKNKGLSLNSDSLKKQCEIPFNENGTSWLSHDKKDITCVFLDAELGLCRVYDDRPLVCRNVLVESDPKICAERTGDITLHLNIFSEILTSANLNLIKNKNEYMVSKFVNALKREGETCVNRK